MAGVNAGVVYVDVIGDTSKLGASIKSGVSKGTSGLGSQLKSSLGLLGVTLGAAFAVGFAKKSLEAFDALEKAQSLLEIGLENVGQGNQLAGLETSLNKVSDQTFITRDATDSMAASVLNLGHVYFQSLGPAAADLLPKIVEGFQNIAAAGGKLAARTLPALERVLFTTPAKAIPLLQKLGVVTADEAEGFKKLADAGRNAELTQELVNKVIGAYPDAAGRSATASQKLAYEMSVLEENIGRLLVPIVTLFTNIVKFATTSPKVATTISVIAASMLVWFKVLVPLGEALKATALGEAAVAAATGDFVLVEGVAIPATEAFSTAVKDLAASFVDLLVAMAPVAAVVGTVYVAFEIATGKAGHFFETIGKGFGPQVTRLVSIIHLMATANLSWADAVSVVDGKLDSLTFSISKSGHRIDNFASLTKKSLKEFRDNVAQSLQVTIGDFKKLGDAFKETPKQLENQANAALKIAKTEHRDLATIFGSKDLTDAQKRALANLAPDQRHAWVEAGKAARAQIADDAVKIQQQNDKALKQVTAHTKGVAHDEGQAIGQALDDGVIKGINAKSGVLSATAAQVITDAIRKMREAAAAQSPSKETEKLGKDLMLGLVQGMTKQLRVLGRAASAAIDVIKGVISTARDRLHNFLQKGLTEDALRARGRLTVLRDELTQALDLNKAVNQAVHDLDRLKAKFKEFRSSIVSGFSQLKDLAGGISALFGKTDTNGNPITPTSGDIANAIASQVAQAQQLADLLKQAAGAGLSKNLLAQFAGQGAAAIPELQALLANPELIAQLNAAAAEIQAAAASTANALGDRFFGAAIRRASDRLDNLSERLHAFLADLRDKLSNAGNDVVNALEHIADQLKDAHTPHLAMGGIVNQPTLALIGEAGPEAVVPLHGGAGAGGMVVNVTVNGWVGSDQQIANRIRDAFIRTQRNNPKGLFA